jgi:primase-polymerase (primpol)-like protein
MTFLFAHICPRHNKFEIDFRDYGNCDYHEDPYFDQFGGYGLFRHSVSSLWPQILDVLGGEKFISNNEIQNFRTHADTYASPEGPDTSSHDENKGDEEIQRYIDKFNDYLTDHHEALINAGVEAHEHVVENINRLRKRRESAKSKTELGISSADWDAIKLSDGISPKDFPHIKGVLEIFDGSWSGKPHWVVED